MLVASKKFDGQGRGHWGWDRDLLKDITFYHQDVLGSVAMLTDKNGQVEERYQYDIWGKAYDGKFADGFPGCGQSDNVYGFTGQRFQAELGVYSFPYRDYDPRTMRWLTEDPVKDGLNWYQYCENDPINYIDISGLWGENIHYGSEEYGGTKAWAQEVGFSEEQAEAIARADQNVDSPFSGKCPIPIIGDQSYHFNTNSNAPSGSAGDSRMEHAAEHLDRGVEAQNKANELSESKAEGLFAPIVNFINNARESYYESKASNELGKGLHALQDTNAHTDDVSDQESILGVNYISHLGHEDVDNPAKHQEAYAKTEEDTKAYLSEFQARTGKKG